jgi:hypothetical protein
MGIRDFAEFFEEAATAVDGLSESYSSFADRVLEGNTRLENLTNLIKKFTDTIGGAALTIEGLGLTAGQSLDSILPEGFASKVVQTVSGIGDAFQAFNSVVSASAAVVNTIGTALDAVTAYNRGLTKGLYESTKAYGLNLDSIEEYRKIIDDMPEPSADTGWMAPADLREAMKDMASAGIPLEKMNDIIVSTRGETNLLTTAFLHAKALGMDMSRYMGLMANAMNSQGLSTQKAAEQMSMFNEVSKKTGFTIERVASHLQGISDSFSKLGMTAEFGKPLLEGFSRSLTSMGFGFENALELSKELSNSIADLSTNYSMAYLTFQRGGLEMGGGGPLSAGISMQARMLRAKEEGTQGELALEMAGAMKETLASMTGGNIVSMTEAEQSPELAAIYYTQTQLLKSMYNISDGASQARTLEMLQQLGEAGTEGDINLAEAIGEEMNQSASYQDKILSNQERTGKYIEGTFHTLNKIYENQIANATQLSNLFVSGVNSTIRGALLEGAPITPPPQPSPAPPQAPPPPPTPPAPPAAPLQNTSQDVSLINEGIQYLGKQIHGFIDTANVFMNRRTP